MSDDINIVLGILAMILVGDSWLRHYRVQDGIARIVLLWFNSIIFLMVFFRTLGYLLYVFNVLDMYASRTWNQYVVLFIYVIIIGQQCIQRRIRK